MAQLKPIYLFHGTDVVRVGSARKRIIDRAKSVGDAATLEIVEGDACTASQLADQLAAVPLSFGWRYIVADGVENFKAGELKPLEEATAELPEETTLVMLGRDDPKKRVKTVVRLTKMVEARGGEVRKFDAPKPWELPNWVTDRAKDIGVKLDRSAAEELVTWVGSNQERLLRELEKIETAMGDSVVDRQEVRELASGQAQSKVFEIGGALLSGERDRAIGLCEESLSRGEDPLKLIYLLARQMRNVLNARTLLESGHTAKEMQSKLGLSPFAVKHVAKQAKGADADWLKQSICGLAELEYSVKGGGSVDSATSLVASLAREAGR